MSIVDILPVYSIKQLKKQKGTAVVFIVKFICHIRAYILYANSCAAVNLCHRLLEERWDGGSIVSIGGLRR
jgi:hypothetical protein